MSGSGRSGSSKGKSGSPKALIAPSMLSSDFARLAEEAQHMCSCGADWLHMDIMVLAGCSDGHFVPNITIGPPVIKSLRKHTDAFLDIHMMVTDPDKWFEDFKKAGADQVTFHVEATDDPLRCIKHARSLGLKVAAAVKPKTPVDVVFPYADQLDMVLVMTVEPGFGGQKFMGDMMPKVKELRKRFPSLNVQVDGGLAPDTVDAAAKAGANVIVAGSSVFGSKDPKATIQVLRDAVDKRK